MSYGWFCPTKVYRCPCLTQIIKQIADWDIHRLDDIGWAVEDLHQGSGIGSIYSIHVDENKENVMFTCQAHLI